MCRGTMSEGMDTKEKEVFEEAEIIPDAAAKVSMQELSGLLSKNKRQR